MVLYRKAFRNKLLLSAVEHFFIKRKFLSSCCLHRIDKRSTIILAKILTMSICTEQNTPAMRDVLMSEILFQLFLSHKNTIR